MAIKMMTDKSVCTGHDNNGKPHYRAQLIADTAAELAGVTEQDGVVWDFGSTASTADGKELMLDSKGVWHVVSGGGSPDPPAEKLGVTLYDYDGTIIAGYTAAEFAAVSALPDPPEHEFLTFAGWSYSLTEAKSYAAAYGRLDIGAMYRVTDGKTRLFITLNDGRLAPTLGLGVDGSVDVDWGDGTAHETLTGTDTTVPVFLQHTYTVPGDYVIAITTGNESEAALVACENGLSALLIKSSAETGDESNTYRNAIKSVYIGDASIGDNAFFECFTLSSVVIPDSVTSIGDSAFGWCRGLGQIKFEPATPPTVDNSNAFNNVPADCIIYVPTGTLAVYTAAENYPDPNTYTYLEY